MGSEKKKSFFLTFLLAKKLSHDYVAPVTKNNQPMKKKTTTTRRRKLDLTPEQKAASEERKTRLRAIATSIKELAPEKVEAESKALGLIPSVEGHEMSAFNSMFLRRQLATVSEVGGFRQWKKNGRKVKKGSKALALWMPSFKENEETGDNELAFFRIVNVFDISQTEEI